MLDAGRLFELIRPYPVVKAIVYGHSHVYEVQERQGISLINLPAVGYNFRDQDPVGWVEATLTSKGMDLTLHALGGDRSGDGAKRAVRWG